MHRSIPVALPRLKEEKKQKRNPISHALRILGDSQALPASFTCEYQHGSVPPNSFRRFALALSASKIPAWSVKTGHAPSRHCRDARVYAHTTSAMHVIWDRVYISPVEYTPTPFLFLLSRHTFSCMYVCISLRRGISIYLYIYIIYIYSFSPPPTAGVLIIMSPSPWSDPLPRRPPVV